jgi:Domain of unknown function (DUF4190)
MTDPRGRRAVRAEDHELIDAELANYPPPAVLVADPAGAPPHSASGSSPSPQNTGYPPPYGFPYPTRRAGTNGFAIASLVLGILWILWIGSILALIFGQVGRNQIDGGGQIQGGRGMAIAGIVLGWIGVGTLLLVLVVGIGIELSS